MSTIYVDVGGTLDQLDPLDACRVLAEARLLGWEVRIWSSCAGGFPEELGAIEKDFHLVKPGDVIVDDDPALLRLARRKDARGIPARDLMRLAELLREEQCSNKGE